LSKNDMKADENNGTVNSTIENGVARITFGHPKSNSLPGSLLRKIASIIDEVGSNPAARVIVLQSAGEGAFCAGASFSELQSISDAHTGREFFLGFSHVILAIRRCPKFVIARVQGKAVGGGVGVAAAADYTLALESSAAKLSELALGIGPFVVGPAVERRIGLSAFAEMSIDYDWRSAAWCKSKGLYHHTFPDIAQLDNAVDALVAKLSASSPEAMAELKAVLWQGTEHWEQLLPERAEISGRLVLSPFTKAFLIKAASN
jgi:methylglutaconyl-CoA hydratase